MGTPGSPDTRTLNLLISKLLDFLGTFTASGNKLPTTGGSGTGSLTASIENSGVTMPANWSSPQMGSAVYLGTNTLTASFPFTVDTSLASGTCRVMAVIKTTTAGVVTEYKNGKNGISITAASDVVTVTGMTDSFLNTDTFSITISGLPPAYDLTLDSTKVTVLNPDSNKIVDPVTLVSTTNVAQGTAYYPSSTGFVMDGYKNVCFEGVTSGGVTSTIEICNDPALAAGSWLDVTKAGYELVTNTTGNASFIDASFILDYTMLNAQYIRVKSVTSDASNAVLYTYRLTY